MNDYPRYDRYRYDQYTVVGHISPAEEHLVEDARTRHKEEPTTAKKEKIQRNTSGKGRILLTVMITVLAFSATLFAADLLSGRSTIAHYAALFGLNKKEDIETYYALYAMKTQDMSIAYKNASAVRAEGGAGYVLKDGDEYYVMLNVYTNEKDAKTVAEKEINYGIYEIRIHSLDTEKDTFALFAPTVDLYRESYLILYQAANDLASGKYGEEDMIRTLDRQRELLAAQQEAYGESIRGKEDTLLIEYKVLLSEIRSAFDNLTSDSKHLVADARYYSIMILHAQSLFSKKYA